MVQQIDIYNRALQTFGSRTTVSASEIASPQSNEAIQANLSYDPFRRRLLRMAPWNCSFQTQSLTYISSVPGTPENTSPGTNLWQKGQPAPPWAYEYQYPFDCLKACWVTPQTATGFASGIPITTAVTGGAPSFWQGPPVKFSVGIDQFWSLSAVTIGNPGTGYAVGDVVTLAVGPSTSPPYGAGAVLQVTAVNGTGGVTAAAVVNQVNGSEPIRGGSYFQKIDIGSAQGSTTGSGVGATFNPTTPVFGDQRVIYTNQEFAILNYCRDIADPSVFDDDFQEALALLLGARLCIALTGDKVLANKTIAEANAIIMLARGNDGNEGLKVNDVLPDWIRTRGINITEDYSGPYNTGFDWGSIWPGYT